MVPYRTVSSQASELDQPRPKRGRVIWIIVASLSAHAAVLGAAFAMRAPEPIAPKTEVVNVLAGHVDPETGEFQASGLARARIARR